MLKIEDVKAGDELVCIDRDGFNGSHRKNKDINNFIISQVRAEKGWVRLADEESLIWKGELKYFKKKEQSQQYMFDDLIDVAVQAKKDGVIKEVTLGSNYIMFIHNGIENRYFDQSDNRQAINNIKSFYKETFVIECEDDLNKIKREVGSIVLSNGEDIIDDVKFSENKPYFTNDGVSWVRVPFSVLKGATVEQERTHND